VSFLPINALQLFGRSWSSYYVSILIYA
jgi:hypothetical protein